MDRFSNWLSILLYFKVVFHNSVKSNFVVEYFKPNPRKLSQYEFKIFHIIQCGCIKGCFFVKFFFSILFLQMNKYSFKSTRKKQAVFIVYLQCLRTSQCLCNILIVYIRESASNVNGLVMECATVSRKKVTCKKSAICGRS